MRLTLILISFLLVSCAGEEAPLPPANAIPEDRFVPVMVDVHLVEATINQKFGRIDDTTSSSQRYYEALFEKHHITRTEFDSTFNYYKRNPRQMEKIYQQVNDSLESLSKSLKEQEAESEK